MSRARSKGTKLDRNAIFVSKTCLNEKHGRFGKNTDKLGVLENLFPANNNKTIILLKGNCDDISKFNSYSKFVALNRRWRSIALK